MAKIHPNFTYADQKKDYIFVVRRRKSVFAPIQRELLTIPSRPGAYPLQSNTHVRIEPVDIEISPTLLMNLDEVLEDFSSWIIQDEPQPLIFDNEPNRVYYAYVDGEFQPQIIGRVAYGTINFICPDPYKYSSSEKISYIQNSGSSIVNNGSAETPPTFILNVLKESPYIDLIGEDAYMRLGQIPSVEDTVFTPKTNVINDPMNSTIGWTTTNFTMDFGTITADGVITSDGTSLLPQSYGTSGSLLWHGPAVAKSLPSPEDDYVIRFRTYHNTVNPLEVGRSNLFLLDVNNKPIARLTLAKGTSGQISTPEIRLLGLNGETQYVINKSRDEASKWINPYVFLELKKDGNIFTARTGRTRDEFGRTEEQFLETFTDTQGIFDRPVASVALVFMKYSNKPTLNRNRAYETLAHRINQQVGIPNIVKIGDVVEIDHAANDIRINGETRLIKTFGSSFFDLKKGVNPIIIEPNDGVQAEVHWRERFK